MDEIEILVRLLVISEMTDKEVRSAPEYIRETADATREYIISRE